jgi:hypothetical protein
VTEAEHGGAQANGSAPDQDASVIVAGAPDGAPAAAQATSGPAPGSGKRRRRKRKREIRPPERRCATCLEFLTDRKTLETPCKQCGTAIYWPPESQLQTHLGAWAAPGMCGACKRDATEAARAAQREALRHGGMVLGSNGEVPPAPEPEPAAAETAPAPEAPAPEAT